jgi:hypothetical protein
MKKGMDPSSRSPREFFRSKEEISMRKAGLFALLVLTLATAGVAQNLPRFELNVYGGYGLYNINTATDYNYSWTGSYYYLDMLGSSSNFTATSSGGVAFGGGLAFYFHPNIGIGLDFGYFRTSVESVTNSSMWFSWTGSSLVNYDTDYLDDPISVTGVDNYFQSMPISFNLIARFGQERFQGYFSAGPTLFMNKVFLQSEIALALEGNIGWAYQAVDVIRVPTELNQSWTSFGVDFGAGFTYWLAPSFGMFLDARYYFSPKKTFDWTYFLDTYDGLYGNFYYDFDNTDVDWIYDQGQMTSLVINPSFLRLGLGFKIRLY